MRKINYLLLSAMLLFAGNSMFAQYFVAPTAVPGSAPAPVTLSDYNKLVPEDSYSLPWNMISEKDLVWRKRVWREIDTKDDKNKLLRGNSAAPNSSLANILVEGFFQGAYKVYTPDNDLFNNEISKADFIALLSHSSPNAGFNPAAVTKFRIKEDWLFLKDENKIVVRIVGLAPLKEVTNPDGTVTSQPAFWLYYPSIRNYLSQRGIINSNSTNIKNWDQLFEGRCFKGTIEKVSGYPEPHMPPAK